MRSIAPKLALLAIAVLLALLLAELAVRIFALGPQIAVLEHGAYRLSENPEIGYEIAPGSTDTVHFKHNSVGLRGEEVTIEKAAGIFRIACLGDSITYGNGMFPHEPYPKLLQDLLNHHLANDQEKYEVLNFGVSGYSIRQVLATAKTRLPSFAPDVAIYGYCLNDPQVYSLENDILLAKLSDAEREFLETSQGGILSGETKNTSVLQRSRLYILARYVLQKQAAKNAPPSPEADDPNFPRADWNGVKGHDDPQFQAQGRGEAESYYGSLHKEGQAGWETVRYALGELGSHTERTKLPLHVAVFPYLIDLAGYDLKKTHQRIIAEASAAGLHGHDFFPASLALQKETDEHIGITYDGVSFDQLHPGKEAHDLYARLLFYELAKAGQLNNTRSPADIRAALAGDDTVGARVFGKIASP